MLNNCKNAEILREHVTEGIKETVVLFRQGLDSEGYTKLVNLFDSLEKLIKLSVEAEEGKVVLIRKINSNLSKALQAMEQGDPLLLADYLEYKILPDIIEL